MAKVKMKVEWTMKTDAGYMAKVVLESPGRTVFGYGTATTRKEAIAKALARANGRVEPKRDKK